MERTARTTFWWTFGTVLTIAVTALWIAFPSEGIRGFMLTRNGWQWPINEALHAVAIVGFIGLRTAVDLRLTTSAFREIPIGELVRKLTPATIIAAVMIILTGMAFYNADYTRFSASPAFLFKMAILAFALLNIWYLHAIALRKIDRRNIDSAPPVAARVSAFLSLTLWVALIAVSALIDYSF